ncbi:MAG: homoaconitase [bacterium]
MGQNLIEKIAQKYAVGLDDGQLVVSGDFISIRPAYIMTHDNTGAVIPKFKSIGAKKFANPRQVVHTLDHNVQDTSEKNLEKYRKIEEFSKTMGADFYPAGRGIGHQIMCEEGYAFPGTMAVASDSHSNMYGGLGCLGTPIVRTDAASIWATGRTWWQIPPIAKVNLNNTLNKGVTGKDLIIALCGYFNNDEVLNYGIEFSGKGVSELSVEQRLTIANMTTEWGALVGLFPIDETTINWLKKRNLFIAHRGLSGVNSDMDGKGKHPRINDTSINNLEKAIVDLKPDEDAFYSKIININLSSIEPYVSGPNTVKKMTKVSTISNEKISINKAYLLSCVNSRVDDIAEAAAILKNKKVANHVKFYIAAASSEVQQESEIRGDWQILINAGAIPLPPSCGPCIGLGTGLLEDGEVGISATNRNFKGRMGSPSALAYLASPAVVAASAAAGYITNQNENNPVDIAADITSFKSSLIRNEKVKIVPGFPENIVGDLIYCYQNNLNTDGIYPGKYTYNDDFTPDDQAKVVMENYDPEFKCIACKGDILVGGFNFGNGSSREQAATALKYKGIQLVIAGSFSETYKRNALNNGFLVLEVPELINDLFDKYGTSKLTLKPNLKINVNFVDSVISFDNKIYYISPVGKAAQELIIDGGLENWVCKNLE